MGAECSMPADNFQGRNPYMTFFNQAAGPVLALLSAAALCACGGGGVGNQGSSTAGGKLTLSAATPVSHNTTVNLDQAAMVMYTEIQAGASPSDPYLCTLNFAQAPGADGASYTLQLAFLPVSKQAVTVLVLTGDGWAVAANDSAAMLTGVAINTQAHTVSFNNLALTAANSGATDAGVLNGSLQAPPAGAARCVL